MDNLFVLLTVAFVTMSSPGPATLTILGTSMSLGRRAGIAVATGILCGSVFWSVLAAMGTGALMASNVWIVEILRISGVAYLAFLAVKSGLSAFKNEIPPQGITATLSVKAAFLKGLMIHLTNPKAIFLFGSLYAVGVSPEASFNELTMLVVSLAFLAAVVFFGYALLFSSSPVARLYVRFRRSIQGVFALIFGSAAIKLAMSRL